jgi:hypothetical protein
MKTTGLWVPVFALTLGNAAGQAKKLNNDALTASSESRNRQRTIRRE